MEVQTLAQRTQFREGREEKKKQSSVTSIVLVIIIKFFIVAVPVQMP